MRSILLFFNYYLLGIEAASAVVGLILVRKSWPSWYRLLVILCCATIVSEVYSYYRFLHHIHSRAHYNTWAPLETFLVVYILFRETTLRWSRRLSMSLLILLPVTLVIAFMLPPGFAQPNMYADTAELLIMLVAACAVLIDVLHDMSGASLYANPAFWLALGILVSSSLFTLTIVIRSFVSREVFIYLNSPFSVIANTFMYGGFIVCFWTLRKEDKRNGVIK